MKLRRAFAVLTLPGRAVGNVVIPPPELRFGGANFSSDEDFIASGISEANRLAALGLGRQSSMLDFGCGPGRLAIGLQATLGRIENYVGVDVNKTAIRWCRRHLANPGFTFELLSSRNARYNPRGRAGIDRLPLDEETMDFAYLYSVFSHMGSQDVANVLESIHPVLRRDGAIFATAFVEDGVPHEEENPADYMMPWSGPLHCVRFERGHFEALARSAGFDVEQLTTHEETDGQSAFILRRTDRQAPSSC